MKILFMGTPDIASGCLQKLIDEKYDVIGVVTQPDKQVGRGKKIVFSPVKQVALDNNLAIYQPNNAKDQDFVNEIKNLNPDIIVVVAYGQILSKEFLDIPKYGCINVHVSLLPKYRGAAPINWVIINGEEKTGVSIMFMDEGLDSGDIISQSEFKLDDEITAGELHDKMTVEGSELLCQTLELIKQEKATRTPQNHEEFTYAPIMDKNLGHIDFTKTAREVHNLVRGVNPWPSAYTNCGEKKMKVWKTSVLEEKTTKKPGTVLKVDKAGIKVATGENIILITEIQMPNKKRMEVKEFIKGNSIEEGTILN